MHSNFERKFYNFRISIEQINTMKLVAFKYKSVSVEGLSIAEEDPYGADVDIHMKYKNSSGVEEKIFIPPNGYYEVEE